MCFGQYHWKGLIFDKADSVRCTQKAVCMLFLLAALHVKATVYLIKRYQVFVDL